MLEVTDYILFIGLALIAEIIGTISGFGSSILFVPIASLFFDFTTVLGITAVFHVFSNLSKILLFRKGIDKNIALKLGIPAVIFVSIGAFLTKYIASKIIETCMYFILMILAIYLVINFSKKLKSTNKNLYIGGILSGFIAGIAGTGGAIRGLTLAAFQLPKDVFIATSALIDLGVDSSRAAIYIWNGYLSTQYLVLLPFLIGISILGSFLGKLLLKRTNEKTFRIVVLSIIVASAVFQLLKFFFFP
ncbi:MAG: sulfite exporter TauE/SafE family protein [Bacteroidota bacterium]